VFVSEQKGVCGMETIDNNKMSNETGGNPEMLAGWIASFATAFACFAAMPIGLRAGWELSLTPAALACVLAGSWSLGIAAGGYASLFWKRLLTPKGRAMMLVAAAWAAGGLASVDRGSAYLVLFGVVGMISAAMFASQFRPRATVQGVVVATVWALAGVCAALGLIPAAYDVLANTMMGPVGAWRMALVAPAALLVVAAVAAYQLTRVRPMAETNVGVETTEESIDVPEHASIPAEMAAAA
jgi:hypothetical protein